MAGRLWFLRGHTVHPLLVSGDFRSLLGLLREYSVETSAIFGIYRLMSGCSSYLPDCL